MTATVALAEAGVVPDAPEHVTLYVVVTAGDTVTVPDVPGAVKPVPVQDVALVEDNVSVADEPEAIEVGEADRVAVGAEGGGVVPLVNVSPTVMFEVTVTRQVFPVAELQPVQLAV